MCFLFIFPQKKRNASMNRSSLENQGCAKTRWFVSFHGCCGLCCCVGALGDRMNCLCGRLSPMCEHKQTAWTTGVWQTECCCASKQEQHCGVPVQCQNFVGHCDARHNCLVLWNAKVVGQQIQKVEIRNQKSEIREDWKGICAHFHVLSQCCVAEHRALQLFAKSVKNSQKRSGVDGQQNIGKSN